MLTGPPKMEAPLQKSCARQFALNSKQNTQHTKLRTSTDARDGLVTGCVPTAVPSVTGPQRSLKITHRTQAKDGTWDFIESGVLTLIPKNRDSKFLTLFDDT